MKPSRALANWFYQMRVSEMNRQIDAEVVAVEKWAENRNLKYLKDLLGDAAIGGDEAEVAYAEVKLLAIKNEELRKIMETSGFRHHHSGGGCTAYIMTVGDREIWVTNEASAPESINEPVVVGLYSSEDPCSDPIEASVEFPNLVLALRHIEKLRLRLLEKEGDRLVTCPTCGGVEGGECKDCNGDGKFYFQELVEAQELFGVDSVGKVKK